MAYETFQDWVVVFITIFILGAGAGLVSWLVLRTLFQQFRYTPRVWAYLTRQYNSAALVWRRVLKKMGAPLC